MAAKCTRLGCGQEFDPASNDGADCRFHPGQPKFHEGLKSYTCCETTNRPVLSFDDWLAIPGCATGSHSTDAERPQAVDTGAPVNGASNASVPAPAAAEAAPAPSQPKLDIPPRPPLPVRAATPVPSVWDTKEFEQDPDESKPAAGAKCKRPSCGVEHADDLNRSAEECAFHAGVAVFHEGSKGWSCCKPRVLEFDEFLKLPGCTRSRHLFVGGVTPNGAAPEILPARTDFYQTPTQVIVSLFGKGADKQASSVTFTHWELAYDLRLPGGKRVAHKLPLFGPIDPNQSTYKVMSTKTECTLIKADGRSWPVLEHVAEDVKTADYTFGVGGKRGTVGAKEAVIAPDRMR